MTRQSANLSNENGAAIISVLLVLVILTIIGVSASNNSNIEVQIATNDTLQKMAFFEADGGTEVGIELLELCIDEKGFASGEDVEGNIRVFTGDLHLNPAIGNAKPSSTNRDARFPPVNTRPMTRLRIGGATSMGVGSATQMIAGYEGAGKGSAGGGSWVDYNIRSQHEGARQNEAVVDIIWRHLM